MAYLHNFKNEYEPGSSKKVPSKKKDAINILFPFMMLVFGAMEWRIRRRS